MTLVSNVVKYYADCIREEAKYSAFINIKDNKEVTYIDLGKNNKVLSKYPEPIPCVDKATELTEAKIKAEAISELHLTYVYKTVEYFDKRRGKNVVAPLLTIPCEVERIGGQVCVQVLSDKPTLNPNIFMELLEEATTPAVIKQLLNSVPSLPMDEQDVEHLIHCLVTTFPALNEAKFHNNGGVVLAKMGHSYANIYNELLQMSEDSFGSNETCLASLTDFVEEVPVPYDTSRSQACSLAPLSPSQYEALKTVDMSRISAIIGGPGCGKSNTILGIASSYIANGKSVLIASKMNEAVDVIEGRLDGLRNDLNCPVFKVRTGNKDYRKKLAVLIEDILSGVIKYDVADIYPHALSDLAHYEQELANLLSYKKEYAEAIGNYNRVVTVSNNLTKFGLKKLKAWLDVKVANAVVKEHERFIKTFDCDEEQFGNYIGACKNMAFISSVNERYTRLTNPIVRQKLFSLAKAITSKYGNVSNFADDFKTLTSVIPCWMTTINDVADTIPLVKGLFDVVIIDETSQCDIASALPLLYRAKHAVVVGDNKQIKFMSFLENNKAEYFAKSNEIADKLICSLNYKSNSLFDFGMLLSSKKPVMLKECFRGGTNIMAFSNQEFYNGQLSLLGSKGDIATKEYTDGVCEAKKTRNFVEAQLVVDYIKGYISGNDLVGDNFTIGVLSPFQEQVKLIRKMISQEIPDEAVSKYKILVGTAHAFQGNERDVMLLSWVVDKNSHVQSYTFLNNPNLFNVAITRAKQQVVNIVSAKPIEMPQGLLRKYLSSIK